MVIREMFFNNFAMRGDGRLRAHTLELPKIVLRTLNIFRLESLINSYVQSLSLNSHRNISIAIIAARVPRL
jgi:hypothetical protein